MGVVYKDLKCRKVRCQQGQGLSFKCWRFPYVSTNVLVLRGGEDKVFLEKYKNKSNDLLVDHKDPNSVKLSHAVFFRGGCSSIILPNLTNMLVRLWDGKAFFSRAIYLKDNLFGLKFGMFVSRKLFGSRVHLKKIKKKNRQR